MSKIKIAAVIVTYNRIDLLKKVLKSFDEQSRHPDYIIIVNNASIDGTKEYLENWENEDVEGQIKFVLHTKSNLGGSGGFYLGTEKAMQTDATWIWVSDDDAFPHSDVFEKAEKHFLELGERNDISAICTQVKTDGTVAESNRSRRNMGLLRMSLIHVPEEEYKKNVFECDNFSYVGVFMNSNALKKVGLINKEYFIWRDDVEHSWRLSSVGKIYCYPDMIVDHQIKKMDYDGVSWKTYYAYRNDMLMYKAHNKFIYYCTKILTAYIKSIREKNPKAKMLYRDAIKGARLNEKGLNKKYYPGIKI